MPSGGWFPFSGQASNSAASRVARAIAAGIWLVYLVLPLRSVTGHGHSAGYTAGAIALTVVFAAIYLWLIVFCAPVLTVPRRVTEAAFGVIFVIALASTLLYGGALITMWLFVAASAAWGIRDQRRGLYALAVTIGCYLILGVTTHLGPRDYLTLLLPILLASTAGIAIRRRMATMKQLTQARDEVEQMAAANERLRLARDLHDLTGQSLSTITLKSELAARLIERLPAGPERDRARDEIEQVAAVSRQTLSDIRQAISGYRRPTLAVEIITARNALESAGITPHDDSQVTLASGTFGQDEEGALAWCLREAVTNVIRHSGARNCHIGLTRRSGAVSLSVRDDGGGAVPAGGARPGASGAGLRGMSERLSAVGGELELSPGAGGFALTATVPAGRRATVAS